MTSGVWDASGARPSLLVRSRGRAAVPDPCVGATGGHRKGSGDDEPGTVGGSQAVHRLPLTLACIASLSGCGENDHEVAPRSTIVEGPTASGGIVIDSTRLLQ